jgi:prepilin-type N-terminal cleavage/methylation domain-containing protein
MIKGYDLGTRGRRFGPKSGFSIVELIVVIVVMGILASVTIVSYGSWKHSTLSAAVKSDLNGVVSAMEDYRTFNNDYPSSIPTTFIPSSGVSLTVDSSSTATDYCINGVSTKDTSITFYVASAKKDQGAIQGTCADLTGVTAPGVPSNLVVISFAGSSVSLAWNAVAGAGNNYTAQCSYDAVFINNLQQSTQSTTSATLSGFTPSTIYCRVNATNAAGRSSWSSTITSTASLLNGLVAWYPFSGNAKDATGNGNNGVVNGASLTYGIEGKANSAYTFTGDSASGSITMPMSVPRPTASLSVSAWVKIANVQTSDGQKFLSTTESGGFTLAVDETCPTMFSFSVYISGGYKTACSTLSTDLNNTWVLVTGVYDGSNVRLYINGSSIAVTSTTGAMTYGASTVPLCIGSEPTGTSCTGTYWYLTGQIDDVRLYDRALSAAEVSDLNTLKIQPNY